MQPYPRRWQALGVLSLCLLVIAMGNTILNVGLPTIRAELDASSSELQWILDGYLLVFAGLLLAAGSLGDRIGRRRMLIAGLSVFALGSILAALATDAATLIAARAVMGLGAAGIMPTTLSILTNIFPAHERPKAIAIWSAVAGLGIAIGPVSGGYLLEHFNWGSIFLVNVPVVIACLTGALVLIPESRDPESRKADLPGTALSIAGLSAVVWGLIEAPGHGWTSPEIIAAFAAGLLALAGFVAWERHTDHPMLDVTVFRNPRFSAASVSIMFVFFSLMGVMYFFTSYLQSVLGDNALEAGVRMLPIALGMIVASRLAVALTQRAGTKASVTAGLVFVAASLGLIGTFDTGTGGWLIAAALGTMGFGMGLVMAPATEAIMGTLPREKAGVGSAMNDVVRELGATLGVAVLGSILTSSYGSKMDAATAALPPEAAHAASDSVGAAHEIGGVQLIDAANSAFVDAMATTASLAAAAALIGALIALAFLPSRAASPAAGRFEPVTA